jgi:kynurenine formamidase
MTNDKDKRRSVFPEFEELPDFDDLPKRDGVPCSWGLWGERDVFGTLNLLTPQKVVEAAGLVREGKVFPLNWSLSLPHPPLFARSEMKHQIAKTPFSADDHIDGFNTQSSSQWDGFLHIRHPAHGHYGGDALEQLHGIDRWAKRGIAGRAVLADVARWREANGRPLEHGTPDAITTSDLDGTLEAQGTELQGGDILLVRTGWIEWYEALGAEERAEYANMANFACPGLVPGLDTARWLWDKHIAAVAADNPSCEIWPPGTTLDPSDRSKFWSDPQLIHQAFLHTILLPMLGIPIGEMWYLDELADDCSADGRFEVFVVSAPLNLEGGIASPPNAVAIK